MKLNLSHSFLWVILVVVGFSISQVMKNAYGSLVLTVLYVAYGFVWASLISFAQNYLEHLDDLEKE